ncbi:hypothetical protein CFIO01_02654 [Colletotrichum fioriniae PJ7]|uniref:F-box domain-containing protein n=1 Tax=Colletotrichum fioriniae PJ7 TaxID=1445577 RepID=A0A010RNF4_9PEZI|nr:hypothetical protein CFIO01_02654 [Colletotrichum fioriniae PJ7]
MTPRLSVTVDLDCLPAEVFEQIILSITDLRSIYNLVVASPAASRVFVSSQVGPEALDSIFSGSMSPDVVALICLVSLARTATSDHAPASSLQDFVEMYTKCLGRSDSSRPSVAMALDLATSLRGQSPQLVRGILLTARRICCLTWACLEHYRNQWSLVSPAHLESPFRYGTGYEKPWRQNPRGKLYKPKPIGPACWMEEQRIMRGFWRLQLLFELNLAISEKRLNWSLEDSNRHVATDILFQGWTWQREEFLTVVDFVDHVQGSPVLSSDSRRLPAPPKSYDCAEKWQDPALPGVIDSRWSREEISRLQPPTWTFYITRLVKNAFSPIRGVPFWPYRRLGLAIWEEEKLEALEICISYNEPGDSRRGDRPTSMCDQVFTWRSLLSPELIAKLQTDMEVDFHIGFRFPPR